ncbi:hypothetical protein HMPREF1219_00333 [Corynebacterium pyruviciproducens ATCC BAA-1742]|uniref:Fe/B12 periplasmic-binding domain-containing protein n=2 Tax=Corynebacterium pyruviciproducens TaxID=598660 RepID=S2ZM26_9CORY|nr:hypothetical protein HMPREF1219_00333 [Corynebacterium pyruviciproducens ATCC BAA-1742]
MLPRRGRTPLVLTGHEASISQQLTGDPATHGHSTPAWPLHGHGPSCPDTSSAHVTALVAAPFPFSVRTPYAIYTDIQSFNRVFIKDIMRSRFLAASSALTALSLCFTLSACGTNSSDQAQSETSSAAETLSVDNCGFTVTAHVPVQRATTMEQGATDTLLLLGAKDQIAGYGHQKDAPPAGYSIDGLKEISPSVPNSEQLRDADTDFILTPFKESWTPDSAGAREEWQKLEVGTYQSNTECADYGDNAGKTRFELIQKDLTELGKFFGREKEAQALIEEQNAALAGAAKAPEGTTFMLLYSSIGGAPYVAGGSSIVTEMGERSGMTNVFADVKEEWPQVSWEAVAEKDPDVIILADLPKRGQPGDKWEEKVTDLESTPGTKEMKAVKNGAYIVVPGVATSADARSHEVIEAITEALNGDLALKLAK